MKMPSPFGAVLLAALGVVLAICVLFAKGPENILLGILAISSNLVSGALGAFAGHASNNVSAPNATINQAEPKV